MKKRIVSLLLTLCALCCVCTTTAFASEEALTAADELHELGLFNGTGVDAQGNPVYDLEREATRHEAITMLVSLLGKSEEAKSGTWEIPFTDVADWAKPFVGYAYANGLTSGTSATTYGGEEKVTASQYLTFVLGALGYKAADGDFAWDKAWELSDKIGLTDGRYNAANNTFLRGDVAIISRSALDSKMKGGDVSLLDVLKGAEAPFTLTAFGDKWLHEYLMSLGPDKVTYGPTRDDFFRGTNDQYRYYDRLIADEICKIIEARYEAELIEDKGTLETGIMEVYTRVETVERRKEGRGRHISVCNIYGDGTMDGIEYWLEGWE